MGTLTVIFYILICILFFSLAVAIHEFGHFIVALKLGLRVERFSIGFGPAIWKKTYKGVEYRVGLIWLGGYVSIPDLDPEGTKVLEGASEKARQELPVWKEFLVALAGPLMNIVLAVVLAIVLSLIPSAHFGTLPAVIGETIKDGPAEIAGLQSGDRVLQVASHPVQSWSEMQTEVQISGGQATEFLIERGEEKLTLTITPIRDQTTGAYFIAALSQTNTSGSVSWMPSRNPLRQLQWDMCSIVRVLKGLTTPKEIKATGSALGGPIMIAEGIYSAVRRNFWDGVGFLRFLNVNLAILNLLPIPVLDGGIILFCLIAMIIRRRVPSRIHSFLSMVFMYLLLGLMLVLIYRDTMRSWRIHTRKPPQVEETAATPSSNDSTDQGEAQP